MIEESIRGVGHRANHREAIVQLAEFGKIFSEFDLTGTETLTIDEITKLIAKLRISVERKYIYPFFKIVDANNSGAIEYDEFEAYIMG